MLHNTWHRVIAYAMKVPSAATCTYTIKEKLSQTSPYSLYRLAIHRNGGPFLLAIMTLETLPSEILDSIVQEVDPDDFENFAITSKTIWKHCQIRLPEYNHLSAIYRCVTLGYAALVILWLVQRPSSRTNSTTF